MERQLSLFDSKIPCKDDYGKKIAAYYRDSKNPLNGEYRGFDEDFKCHYVLLDCAYITAIHAIIDLNL